MLATTSTWDILAALGLFFGGAVAVAGLFFKPLKWIGKKTIVEPFKQWHTASTQEILDTTLEAKLFTKNGNSNSLKDLGQKIDTLTNRFDQHISSN